MATSPKLLILVDLAAFFKQPDVLVFQDGYPKMEVPPFGRYSQALVFSHFLQGMDLL